MDTAVWHVIRAKWLETSSFCVRSGKTMSEGENRHLGRDSLFLMAGLRVDGAEDEHRIKVRNLSAGGMMGEGPVRIVRGAIVEVNLRNIGWVEGSVAWVQDDRFGIAFRDEIDPKIARAKVAGGEDDELFRPYYAHRPPETRDGRNIRKI